jgi:hypothetical protein
MSVKITVKKKSYESSKSNHGEEVMFKTGTYNAGNLNFSMNAWPCLNEKHHSCHDLFIRQSRAQGGRTLILTITEDIGGYSQSHGQPYGATGTITYTNGVATYS